MTSQKEHLQLSAVCIPVPYISLKSFSFHIYVHDRLPGLYIGTQLMVVRGHKAFQQC